MATAVLLAYGTAFWPLWSAFGGPGRPVMTWVLIGSAVLTGVATSWAQLSWPRLLSVGLGAEILGFALAYVPHTGALSTAAVTWLGVAALLSALGVFAPVLAADFVLDQVAGVQSGEVRWPAATVRVAVAAAVSYLWLVSQGLVPAGLAGPAFGLLGLALMGVVLDRLFGIETPRSRVAGR